MVSIDSIKEQIQKTYRQLIKSRSLTPRYGQRQMIAQITNELSKSENLESDAPICVIEAGTGTGKTLAYLISSIPLAKNYGHKVIISTATIALQEQVVLKDIPEILSSSEMSFTYAIAKGRRRYLCLSKLHMLLSGQDSLMALADLHDSDISDYLSSESELYESMLSKLESGSWHGDRDDWDSPVADKVWMPLTADRFQCTGQKCNYFRDCSFYKARDALDKVDCIVSNHDLVLTDLVMGGGAILPEPEKCFYIFDEAHHLPAKSNNHFSEFSNITGTQGWLEGLVKDFSQLRRHDFLNEKEHAVISDILNKLMKSLENMSPILEQFFDLKESINSYENKTLYTFHGGGVTDEICKMAEIIETYFSRFIAHLEVINENLMSLLDELPSPELKELIEAWCSNLGKILERANSNYSLWASYARVDSEQKPPRARWLTLTEVENNFEISLYSSPVLAAENLQEYLWVKCAGAVLTSATLSALGNFEMLNLKAGLPPHSTYLRIPSPFDFKNAAVFSVPKLNCEPSDSDNHTRLLTKAIPKLLSLTVGALMLFSSRKQMQDVRQCLSEQWQDLVLCQDDYTKSELLKYHRKRIDEGKGSIIFGLASFAEGVDLPGKYCESVLIAKIPFSLPNDPIEMTLASWIERHGQNPFMVLSVPEAAFKLVQASGRLIRNEYDKGRITLFDERIVNKRYGKMILNSLPPYRKEIFLEDLSD